MGASSLVGIPGTVFIVYKLRAQIFFKLLIMVFNWISP